MSASTGPDDTNLSFEELMELNGSSVRSTGGETIIDAGFQMSEPEEWDNVLTADDNDDQILIQGPYVNLYEYAKAANRGNMVPLNWQLTGSCVNGGAQTAATIRAGVEICLLPNPERFAIPFTLMAYGQSRYDAYRDTTRGSGSSGAYMAKCLESVGMLPIDDPRLPKPTITGPALVYTKNVELDFSSIKYHPAELRTDAKQFNMKWGAVRNSNEAMSEIRKGRPLTWAGNWGGQDYPRPEQGYLKMRRASTWNHQQSVVAFKEDTPWGLMFLVVNQWYYMVNGVGHAMHKPRSGFEFQFGEPEGSYWIMPADMDYQCRTGEVRSLRNFKGFGGILTPGAM